MKRKISGITLLIALGLLILGVGMIKVIIDREQDSTEKNPLVTQEKLQYETWPNQLKSADDAEKKLAIPNKPTPKIFQAWSQVENLHSGDNNPADLARHDLVFGDTWLLDIGWAINEKQPYEMLETKLDESMMKDAIEKREILRSLNPDIKLLCSINYREGYLVDDEEGLEYWEKSQLPADSEFWIRREDGTIAPGWGEDNNGDGILTEEETICGLIDFTSPDFQDLIAAKAKTLKDSGLFDGIMLDWWAEEYATTGTLDWEATYLSAEVELAGRLSLLQKIREQVGQDFLILVNANDHTIPESASYVNGVFMECYKEDYSTGYSQEQLLKIETTLRWAEENLKEPHINCLEGWRVVDNLMGDLENRIEERNTPENFRWMRLFTTMSLVFSDGYVLFSDDNAMPSGDHLHNWYEFWDADLGLPLSHAVKLQEGVYFREYEKGIVLYNRTESTAEFNSEEQLRDFMTDITDTEWEIDPKDGRILLK